MNGAIMAGFIQAGCGGIVHTRLSPMSMAWAAWSVSWPPT